MNDQRIENRMKMEPMFAKRLLKFGSRRNVRSDFAFVLELQIFVRATDDVFAFGFARFLIANFDSHADEASIRNLKADHAFIAFTESHRQFKGHTAFADFIAGADKALTLNQKTDRASETTSWKFALQ